MVKRKTFKTSSIRVAYSSAIKRICSKRFRCFEMRVLVELIRNRRKELLSQSKAKLVANKCATSYNSLQLVGLGIGGVVSVPASFDQAFVNKGVEQSE